MNWKQKNENGTKGKRKNKMILQWNSKWKLNSK